MQRLPASPCDWSAWSPKLRGNPVDLIRKRLGIKGDKIPAGMHGEYHIDGWTVVVKRGQKSARKSAKHRIFVRHNGDLIPAGRVRQALCRVDKHRMRRRVQRRNAIKIIAQDAEREARDAEKHGDAARAAEFRKKARDIRAQLGRQRRR